MRRILSLALAILPTVALAQTPAISVDTLKTVTADPVLRRLRGPRADDAGRGEDGRLSRSSG